jgi:hypothetical protein
VITALGFLYQEKQFGWPGLCTGGKFTGTFRKLCMKTLNITMLCIIFFTSCNEDSKIVTLQSLPERSKILTVKLADSLGNINITLPFRYDTSFQWTHYSDCGKPCEKVKYRFQPESLPIQMESGFFSDERKDSIDRLTIYHSGYFPFTNKSSDSIFMSGILERHKKNLLMNPETYKLKSGSVEKIGDRYFSIVTVDLFDSLSMEYSKKVLATSTIKGNGISFDFELITKEKNKITDSFINNSLYYLRTVRLSK